LVPGRPPAASFRTDCGAAGDGVVWAGGDYERRGGGGRGRTCPITAPPERPPRAAKLCRGELTLTSDNFAPMNLGCMWPTLSSGHKRQKPQAPTPQAPIRNRQTRKVANAKGLNHNTNLT